MSDFTNISQQARFLRLLDPNAKLFTFQTFPYSEALKEKRGLTHVLHCGGADPLLQELNAVGAGVYVTVNESPPHNRRTANNIRRVRTIFQEDDHAYAGQFPIEPTMVVETSPARSHRYWLVAGDWPADEAGRRDFRGVIERLIANYGSDPGAKDISRVLRVPGFLNHKRAEVFRVRILKVHPQLRRYTRNEILRAFPLIVAPSKISQRRASANSTQPWNSSPGTCPSGVRLRGILDKAASAQEGERNRMIFWCANRIRDMVAEGELDQGEFGKACTDLIGAGTGTGLSVYEVQRTIASALR
jgi:RepB DNA-primase from phage plasmid